MKKYSDPELNVYKVILCLMIYVALIINFTTGFYLQDGTFNNILVELHGSIIDIVIISIISTYYISREKSKQWRKTKSFIMIRLLDILNFYFTNVIGFSNKLESQNRYKYGSVWKESMIDTRLVDSFEIGCLIKDEIENWKYIEAAIPGGAKTHMFKFLKVIEDVDKELANVLSSFSNQLDITFWDSIMECDESLREMQIYKNKDITDESDFTGISIVVSNNSQPLYSLMKKIQAEAEDIISEQAYFDMLSKKLESLSKR